ncbi:TetR/AcrR family transcriptional regulator [Spirilliplanes yamanashiensis]|uniref:TetR family transcriptional regulator n=1 Tax=Spirilliplanes yamanashiensis TaxID=42233 RepID=A0A8J3Y5J2_9ACTN|nr:TetR/AcrR family transcriptional regulator [Spirilliplanes yamanashiensis]MDP9819413.1 AcrR family transcriptional regulator [Spirilliplanes yamanashiensis]GIJ01763.1 TetR family transcriptional regulator [Spirilliplanes yamanashiensis]
MPTQGPARRADAQRNQDAVLAAAAEVFATTGVNAPVRQIADRAGLGVGTLYRHFPTRTDLVLAVYRHQVEACADAGPALLRDLGSPAAALREWVDQFVRFLATKHGLADMLQSDAAGYHALHAYFLDRLVPVCADLLAAAAAAGEIRPAVEAYELMRGIGNLCIGGRDENYDPGRLITLLLDGLRPLAH